MAKTEPFYDTDKGHGLAKSWLAFLDTRRYRNGFSTPYWSLKEAVRQATWQPEKYIAWKTLQRLTIGDKL